MDASSENDLSTATLRVLLPRINALIFPGPTNTLVISEPDDSNILVLEYTCTNSVTMYVSPYVRLYAGSTYLDASKLVDTRLVSTTLGAAESTTVHVYFSVLGTAQAESLAEPASFRLADALMTCTEGPRIVTTGRFGSVETEIDAAWVAVELRKFVNVAVMVKMAGLNTAAGITACRAIGSKLSYSAFWSSEGSPTFATTFHSTSCHGRPPLPVDMERSTFIGLHAPRLLGRLSTTVGTMGLAAF